MFGISCVPNQKHFRTILCITYKKAKRFFGKCFETNKHKPDYFIVTHMYITAFKNQLSTLIKRPIELFCLVELAGKKIVYRQKTKMSAVNEI